MGLVNHFFAMDPLFMMVCQINFYPSLKYKCIKYCNFLPRDCKGYVVFNTKNLNVPMSINPLQ